MLYSSHQLYLFLSSWFWWSRLVSEPVFRKFRHLMRGAFNFFDLVTPAKTLLSFIIPGWCCWHLNQAWGLCTPSRQLRLWPKCCLRILHVMWLSLFYLVALLGTLVRSAWSFCRCRSRRRTSLPFSQTLQFALFLFFQLSYQRGVLLTSVVTEPNPPSLF